MFFRYLFCPSNFRALHPLPTQTQQFAKQIVADPMCTPTKACPVAPPAHLRLEGSQDQCPGYLPEWCHHGGTMDAGNVQTFDQKDHQLSSTLIAWPWHTSLYQHGTCCFKVSPFLSPLPLTRQAPPSVIFQEARLRGTLCRDPLQQPRPEVFRISCELHGGPVHQIFCINTWPWGWDGDVEGKGIIKDKWFSSWISGSPRCSCEVQNEAFTRCGDLNMWD